MSATTYIISFFIQYNKISSKSEDSNNNDQQKLSPLPFHATNFIVILSQINKNDVLRLTERRLNICNTKP